MKSLTAVCHQQSSDDDRSGECCAPRRARAIIDVPAVRFVLLFCVKPMHYHLHEALTFTCSWCYTLYIITSNRQVEWTSMSASDDNCNNCVQPTVRSRGECHLMLRGTSSQIYSLHEKQLVFTAWISLAVPTCPYAFMIHYITNVGYRRLDRLFQ